MTISGKIDAILYFNLTELLYHKVCCIEGHDQMLDLVVEPVHSVNNLKSMF